MNNPISIPPTTEDELFEWVNQVAHYLRGIGSERATFDEPRLVDTLIPSGILAIRREVIQGAVFAPDDHGIQCKVELAETEAGQMEQMLEQGIQPAFGFIVIASRCTRCGVAYEDCECSKLLDEDVAREVTEAWPFAFWTDRPLT
jgi:hypothetical protein